MGDLFRNFGAVPVSGRVFYKLMKMGCSTLLYPGGAREALHRKVFKLLDKFCRYRHGTPNLCGSSDLRATSHMSQEP